MRLTRNVSFTKNTRFRSLLAVTLGAFLFGVTSAQADVLVDFSLEEQLAGVLNTGPFTDVDELHGNISDPVAQGLTSFAPGGQGTAAGEINWTGWQGDYLTIEMTASPGESIALSDLTLRISRNGGGAPAGVGDPLFAKVIPGGGLDLATLDAAAQLDSQEDIIIMGGNAGGSFGVDPTVWDLSSANPQTGVFTVALGYAGTSGGNLRISDIVVNGIAGEAKVLTLMVNKTTGFSTITNPFETPFDINFYEITSASGALNPAGWNSLDAQNVDATDGDDAGDVAGDSLLEGWDEADTLSANDLTEAFLLGGTSFGPGDRQAIGNPYNESLGGEDLAFKYGFTTGGNLRAGNIKYFLGGDMNGDGVVNTDDVNPFVQALTDRDGYEAVPAHEGLDADIYGDMNSDGKLSLGDLGDFVTAVGGLAAFEAARSVPEPSTIVFLGLGLMALVSRRRR